MVWLQFCWPWDIQLCQKAEWELNGRIYTINPWSNTIFVQRTQTPIRRKKKKKQRSSTEKKNVPASLSERPRIGEKFNFDIFPTLSAETLFGKSAPCNVTEGAAAFCRVSDNSSSQVFALPFVSASQPPGFRPLRKDIVKSRNKASLAAPSQNSASLLAFCDG